MTIAYVLINVKTGTEEEVLDKIKALDTVEEAYIAYGTYDILVKVKTDSLEKLKETVDAKIRKLEHVRSSITIIAMEKWMK